MDDVYYTLITFDYPDAVTQGLRRQTDMVRGVLERTGATSHSLPAAQARKRDRNGGGAVGQWIRHWRSQGGD